MVKYSLLVPPQHVRFYWPVNSKSLQHLPPRAIYLYNTTKYLISLSPESFSFALQRAGDRSLAHLCVCECAACALQRTLCSF